MKTLLRIFILMYSVVLGFSPVMAGENKLKVDTMKGFGNYLTDENGVALYWFKKDSPGTSACSGGCLTNWPAFYRESTEPAEGTRGEDYGTITREDGTKQTTFKGYPLYYFAGDKMKKTLTKGHKAREVWFLINPDNFPPK